MSIKWFILHFICSNRAKSLSYLEKVKTRTVFPNIVWSFWMCILVFHSYIPQIKTYIYYFSKRISTLNRVSNLYLRRWHERSSSCTSAALNERRYLYKGHLNVKATAGFVCAYVLEDLGKYTCLNVSHIPVASFWYTCN